MDTCVIIIGVHVLHYCISIVTGFLPDGPFFGPFGGPGPGGKPYSVTFYFHRTNM